MMNISQAINLQKQIQKSNSVEVKLLCTVKEGCALCIKLSPTENGDYDNLERIAVENNLSWVYEEGYWMLFSSV